MTTIQKLYKIISDRKFENLNHKFRCYKFPTNITPSFSRVKFKITSSFLPVLQSILHTFKQMKIRFHSSDDSKTVPFTNWTVEFSKQENFKGEKFLENFDPSKINKKFRIIEN